MRPLRPTLLALALASCAAIGAPSCERAQVSPAGGGRGSGSGATSGGLNLPDGPRAAEDASAGGTGGAAGPAGLGGNSGGPAVVPPDPGGAACAMEVHKAERPQVDLLLLLDSSSSMEQRVPGDDRTKGQFVTDALASFVKDPASAGLGVGLRFFPGVVPDDRAFHTRKPCQSDMECEPNAVCRSERTCLYQGRPIGGVCPGDRFEGHSCQGGEPCVDVARCSLSNVLCHPAGQPCPGGMPGNVCQAAPRLCLPPAGSWVCQPSVYQKPTVPIAELPAAEPALLQAFAEVKYTFGSPVGPAVKGGLALARAHQMANPTHRVALVLGTDGAGHCLPRDAADVSALVAAEARGAPPISTYVIGAFTGVEIESGVPFAEAIATAGGTGKPFVINTDPNLAGSFLDALKKIRDASLPCEFVIPRPSGPIDFAKVNVRVQTGAGSAEDIPYVGAVDRCDPVRGGWYYDVDPGRGTPTRVMTCPASCGRLNTAAGVSVSLVFGCKTIVID